MVEVKVLVCRQSRPKAVQLILDIENKPVLWIPRSAVQNGFAIRDGNRDFDAVIADWVIDQYLEKLNSNEDL